MPRNAWSSPRTWTRDRREGFRIYKPEHCPNFDLTSLPKHVGIIIPPDGGFWLINRDTGIRYRRITMADLPNKASWNNRHVGRRETEEEEEWASP